jgi:hypothetical protein
MRKKEPFIAINCASIPEHLLGGASISFSDVDSIVVQKDFCQELPQVQAQAGYCRLQSGELENLEELRKKQLAVFLGENCEAGVEGGRGVKMIKRC